MKYLLMLAILAIGPTGGRAAPADDKAEKQMMEDWATGETVCSCLLGKCAVFRGALLTDSPRSGSLVEVSVGEGMHGMPQGGRPVSVPYSSEINPKEPVESPGYAWRGAALEKNAPLTVVLALSRVGPVPAGSPLLVTGDERTSGVIRDLTREADRLEASPQSISDSVASLSRRVNPALAGFLYHYLLYRVSSQQLDLASSLLGRMIGNPGVPRSKWQWLAGVIVSCDVSLSDQGRASEIGRFVELSQDADSTTAAAGLYALSRLAGFHPELMSYLTPAVISAVANSYRSLVSRGAIPHSSPLESALGIKGE